jgi:hypothetical protein
MGGQAAQLQELMEFFKIDEQGKSSRRDAARWRWWYGEERWRPSVLAAMRPPPRAHRESEGRSNGRTRCQR